MDTDLRTPVTIITGFLGAGKTTLLNRIISQNTDTRFAIIENEFGETSIDSDLVVSESEDIFELANGCICCTLSGALADTLAKLIHRREQYDHLLIESTGIANPQAVAAPFLADQTVQQYFRLDATLCLVDTPHLEEALKLRQEATWQISAADYLIFNKMDLASPELLAKTKTISAAINPFALQISTQNVDLDSAPLLKVQSSSPQIIEAQTQAIATDHDHQHQHISSQTYHFTEAFDLLKLRHFISVLLMFQSSRIYRMKGILHISGLPERMIFQSVQQQTVFSKGSPWDSDRPAESRLVVIGKDLNRTQFEKRLKSCLA